MSNITKKDYIKIAETIKLITLDIRFVAGDGIKGHELRNQIIARFGSMLEADNPNFDYHRFISYIEKP